MGEGEGERERKIVCGSGVGVGLGVEWQGGEGGEGRKGQRERARQTDNPTRMKTWISPLRGGNYDNYESSYYHHTSILIVVFLILRIADYGLIDHWSINDRLTISYQIFFDLVSIVRSSIDRWSIDSRLSSIDCSFILSIIDGWIVIGLYGSIVRSLAIDHDWW